MKKRTWLGIILILFTIGCAMPGGESMSDTKIVEVPIVPEEPVMPTYTSEPKAIQDAHGYVHSGGKLLLITDENRPTSVYLEIDLINDETGDRTASTAGFIEFFILNGIKYFSYSYNGETLMYKQEGQTLSSISRLPAKPDAPDELICAFDRYQFMHVGGSGAIHWENQCRKITTGVVKIISPSWGINSAVETNTGIWMVIHRESPVYRRTGLYMSYDEQISASAGYICAADRIWK